MKTMKSFQALSLFLVCLLAFSCKKNDISATDVSTSGSSIQAIIAANQAIAVGTSSTSSTSAADSIYIINTCSAHDTRDSITFINLPAAVATYLSTNYNGYAFEKAFSVKDNSGALQGYIVVIQYNGNPVGLKFDATGAFIKVLEQREGRDLEGEGWHKGGHFDDRDGKDRDTLAVSSLPTTIQTYFSTNYPQDTLVRAYVDRDSSYVVFSKDNGAYATIFTSTGTFVKRIQLPLSNHGSIANVVQTALSSNILSYLNTTYSGYVFKQAFSVSLNGSVAGYVVYLVANSTKYALSFDGSGNFIKAIVIR